MNLHEVRLPDTSDPVLNWFRNKFPYVWRRDEEALYYKSNADNQENKYLITAAQRDYPHAPWDQLT